MADEYTDLKANGVIHSTLAAILFDFDEEEKWIPRSAIEDNKDIEVGDGELIIAVKTWFVRKEGLQDYEDR